MDPTGPFATIGVFLGGLVLETGRRVRNTLSDHNKRIKSMEQWLTGENGDSKGAVGRASEEREAIMKKLDRIEDNIEQHGAKQRRIAYHVSRLQNELCDDETVDVDVDPIDVEDDFLNWDQ